MRLYLIIKLKITFLMMVSDVQHLFINVLVFCMKKIPYKKKSCAHVKAFRKLCSIEVPLQKLYSDSPPIFFFQA